MSDDGVRRAGYALIAAALIAAVVATVIHAGEDVYGITAPWLVIAAGAALAGAAGIALGWRARRFGAVVLTMGAVMAAIAAILSLGAFVLAAVVVGVAVAAAATGRRWDRQVAAAGSLLGVGAFVLALTALTPPLVDCARGSAGENIFLQSGGHLTGSGATSSGGSTSHGSVRGDSYVYSYACRDGKLVAFTLRRR